MASEMLAGPAPVMEPVATMFTSHPIAVVRATTVQEELPKAIQATFDRFYAVKDLDLPARGHNVVFYPDWSPTQPYVIECGVLTATSVRAHDPVVRSALPAGRVALLSDLGPYQKMHDTYVKLDDWCKREGLVRTLTFWEEYGDWSDDPATLRTDIYLLLVP